MSHFGDHVGIDPAIMKQYSEHHNGSHDNDDKDKEDKEKQNTEAVAAAAVQLDASLLASGILDDFEKAKKEEEEANGNNNASNDQQNASDRHVGDMLEQHSQQHQQSQEHDTSYINTYIEDKVPLTSVLIPGDRRVSDREASDRIAATTRRVRLRWTQEETADLMEGCKVHGVGNWKKILTDPRFRFNNRTAVDLKDRFRTCFPEDYRRLYPNARSRKFGKKTNVMAVNDDLVKVNRKERRVFTPEEDERLLNGFMKHGPSWSNIQRDNELGLFERRSTDLRDRFRNAFPLEYAAAGFKARGPKRRPVVEATHGNTLQTIFSASDGSEMSPRKYHRVQEQMDRQPVMRVHPQAPMDQGVDRDHMTQQFTQELQPQAHSRKQQGGDGLKEEVFAAAQNQSYNNYYYQK
ncbi:hypothetical protein B0I72DRAFT_110549 [Yarrowia lipolytica]|jgi:hypothetical protein|uniref:telomere-associated protein 1 n=2 Tax=Yarrowia lipolytica TaxID=4952 RepID=TAY1_YARLI|nr:YALI0D10923p [Yarrowia lipolytica CLIB122]Q6C9I6.1 RecName: Full=telomere-associated protein 1 [Yarrowia lipolytica CLIB122]AOW03900.1 hypothetical protein YALI1_D13686g [Yarrowia lipolytica]KAB8283045.1 hypothetical protein BKA91DRAFT_112315 [Yarrowia lipolytica]KAE8172393.1 hypothetical protein BKA90DRAFT_162360 [Yarrowia lipolytica]KAJ8054532.1 hypothetical protein LXG23DRAFT_20294 [Yarrowia lipolytica]QNP97778.1 telomere-associated protein 1 [Yarrowia lipolytica]|eukprot:XP_502676.1 YALI0D10923p [Yarrowia lipolytica CLIB122]